MGGNVDVVLCWVVVFFDGWFGFWFILEEIGVCIEKFKFMLDV